MKSASYCCFRPSSPCVTVKRLSDSTSRRLRVRFRQISVLTQFDVSLCRWVRGRWTICGCVWRLWTLWWSRRSRRSVSATRPRGSRSWTPSRPRNDGSRTSEENNNWMFLFSFFLSAAVCETLVGLCWGFLTDGWMCDGVIWKKNDDLHFGCQTAECDTSEELFSVWRVIIGIYCVG